MDAMTTTIIDGVELKPCPFCGSDDVDVTFTGEEETEAVGYCENCLAEGPVATIGCRDDDEEYGEIDLQREAAEFWNQRAT